jgi:4-hydroxy-3-methylbut-2-enyl diphosphate reductase
VLDIQAPHIVHYSLIVSSTEQTPLRATSSVDKVIVAAPRGFCAGVEMAIKALAWMVRTFESPVYCFHEIVHNKSVVERFVEQGVVFVDDICDVPMGRPVMLSAHGSAPEVVAEAKRRGSYVVDSVCPLVTKVHHEVKVRANKGYRIIYVGHDGHEEAVGTMAVAPGSISRVESVSEVEALPDFDEPVALLAQTTLSHRDWQGVADAVKIRFPQVWTPGRSDLCFATTNRQSALMTIAQRCDSIVVIGSANSSNTLALEKLARDVGCQRVLRVNSASEVPHDLHGTVGVTAGASAPEEIVRGVIDTLNPRLGVEEVRITDEDEYFPPPRNIRQLQESIELAATTMVGAHPRIVALDDRQVSASDVLLHLSAQ